MQKKAEVHKPDLAELEAIRQRITTKRERGFAGTQEFFTPTELADLEFLMAELDIALGHRPEPAGK